MFGRGELNPGLPASVNNQRGQRKLAVFIMSDELTFLYLREAIGTLCNETQKETEFYDALGRRAGIVPSLIITAEKYWHASSGGPPGRPMVGVNKERRVLWSTVTRGEKE
jgi:hypothetical protein